MSSIREATIKGFNEFVVGQQNAPGKASLLLSQFDNEYQVGYDKPIAEVPKLDTVTYVPRGATALFDAIGRTINEVGASLAAMSEADRPQKTIFVIITDGAENASKEFTRNKIVEMVTHQREKYQWEFVFLGANIDAFAYGQTLGIAANASMQYAANAACMDSAFTSTGDALKSFRSGQVKHVAYSQQERCAAMGKTPPVAPKRP